MEWNRKHSRGTVTAFTSVSCLNQVFSLQSRNHFFHYRLFRQLARKAVYCPHVHHHHNSIRLSLIPQTVTHWSFYNHLEQPNFLARPEVWNGLHLVVTGVAEEQVTKWHWVEYLASIINLGCSVMVIFMVLRIVLGWYPKKYSSRFPWSVICLLTEPLLVPVRKWIQPVGGVDISPVIWLFVFSLIRELLVGQQGILILLQSAPG